MVSADLARTVVGILGNIISLGLFLSPMPTFFRIWKKRSVEQFLSSPYLATLLNCMLWCVYGLPLVHPHSMLVITINGTGLLIELFYVLLFLLYSSGKKRMRTFLIFVIEVIFVVAVAILVLTVFHAYEKRSLVVGCFCVFFGTMMYVAPLSVMKMVLRTKSVEYMPLSLSLASFANGICWTTYALIRFDLFITIPNTLGMMFSIVQLILYATFYKSTQRQLEERRGKGETALTEVAVVGGADDKKVDNTLPLNGCVSEIHET